MLPTPQLLQIKLKHLKLMIDSQDDQLILFAHNHEIHFPLVEFILLGLEILKVNIGEDA